MQESPWHLRRVSFDRQRSFFRLELLLSFVRVSLPGLHSESTLWQKKSHDWQDLMADEVAQNERLRLLSLLQKAPHEDLELAERYFQLGQLFATTQLKSAPTKLIALSALLDSALVQCFEFRNQPSAIIIENRVHISEWLWMISPEVPKHQINNWLRWMDGFLTGLGYPSESHFSQPSNPLLVQTQWLKN